MMQLLQRINSLLPPLLMLILLILLALLSSRFQLEWDWTRHGSNSLSDTSIEILQRTPGPLQITAFADEIPSLRTRISQFIERYQRHKPNLALSFVDPAQHPDTTRRQGINLSGELLLTYNGREERLQTLDEQHLTTAIQRLNRNQPFWVAGLIGHGERSLLRDANHDLGEFGRILKRQGYQVVELDLVSSPEPPDNTSLLVIASPYKQLLPGELKQLSNYLDQGRNLMLLVDPGEAAAQQPLLDLLGIEQLPGTIVDANAQELGIDNPAIALVPKYPIHPTTEEFSLISLFPQAAALSASVRQGWQITPLLQTLARSWNETGALSGEIQRDPEQNEQSGPLTIGYALTRQQQGQQQRVLVVGDGDFLSNSFLANAGNLDLGLALTRWLAADEQMLGIPPKKPLDRELHLSPLAKGVIGLGSLIVLPLLLLITGGIITWRRVRA